MKTSRQCAEDIVCFSAICNPTLCKSLPWGKEVAGLFKCSTRADLRRKIAASDKGHYAKQQRETGCDVFSETALSFPFLPPFPLLRFPILDLRMITIDLNLACIFTSPQNLGRLTYSPS